jgi:hypothetical protein
MAAADRLLTYDNAAHNGDVWLAAAWRTTFLYFSARGPAELGPLLERIEAVAAQRGDEFYRRLGRWRKEPCLADAAWRDLARQQCDRYLQAWVPIMLAYDLAEDDPAAATPVVDEAEAVAAASGMRSLREMAIVARAELACSTGHLCTAIELMRDLLQGPFSSLWSDAVRCLSFAALLAEDEDALRCAVDAGERGLRTSPGVPLWAQKGPHRIGLLHGRPSVVSDVRVPARADLFDALARLP